MLWLCSGCSIHRETPDPLLNKTAQIEEGLNNFDVQWHGNWVGLYPVLSKRADTLLKNESIDIYNYCFDLLKHNETYVLAHVLLTQRYSLGYELSGDTWNGLCIDQISAKHPLIACPNQRNQIEKMWIDWEKTGIRRHETKGVAP